MGLERFADVVERFTHGYGNGHAPEPDAAVVKQWQEELNRTARRAENLRKMLTDPVEPKVGQTPREEIYKRNKSRLYRYQSRRTHRTPVLFVPNLGISRPYIFDLVPGGSFVEHMTGEGFDFYLLDWGVFGPEDNDLSFEDCVTKILPRMTRKVLESSARASCRSSATAWAPRWRRPSSPRSRTSPRRTSSTWPGPSTSRRSGSSACGSTRSTSTWTASWTPWAPCPRTW
jgi:hypothetical protein